MGMEVPLCPPRSQASKHFHPKPRKQRNLLSTCVFMVQTPLRLRSVLQLSKRQSAQGSQRRQNKCWASHTAHMYLQHRLPGSLSLLRFRRRWVNLESSAPGQVRPTPRRPSFIAQSHFTAGAEGTRRDGQEGRDGEGIFEFPCEHWVEPARRGGGERRAGLMDPGSALSRPKRCADLRAGVKC